MRRDSRRDTVRHGILKNRRKTTNWRQASTTVIIRRIKPLSSGSVWIRDQRCAKRWGKGWARVERRRRGRAYGGRGHRGELYMQWSIYFRRHAWLIDSSAFWYASLAWRWCVKRRNNRHGYCPPLLICRRIANQMSFVIGSDAPEFRVVSVAVDC